MDFWPNGGNCPMPGTEWTISQCGFSHLRAVVSLRNIKYMKNYNTSVKTLYRLIIDVFLYM